MEFPVNNFGFIISINDNITIDNMVKQKLNEDFLIIAGFNLKFKNTEILIVFMSAQHSRPFSNAFFYFICYGVLGLFNKKMVSHFLMFR